MVMTAGYPLPSESIRQQTEAALDLLIHMGKDHKGQRRIMEMVQICKGKEGLTQMRLLYAYEEKNFQQKEKPDWFRGKGDFCQPGLGAAEGMAL